MSNSKRVTISYEDFINVVRRLTLEGKPVSQRSVRKVLGHGSFNTITAFMQRYRADTKEAAATVLTIDIPEDLREIVSNFVVSVSQSCQALASRQLAQLQQDALEASDRARQEAAKAIADKKAVEDRYATVNAEVTRLDSMLTILKEQIAASDARHSTALAAIESSHKASSEVLEKALEKATLQAAAAERSESTLRAEVEAERKNRDAQQAKLQDRLTKAERVSGEAQSIIDDAKQRADAATATAADLKARLVSAEGQLSPVKSERDALRVELAALRELIKNSDDTKKILRMINDRLPPRTASATQPPTA